MAKLLRIHPDNPQPRLLQQAAAVLQAGGVIVYPTDAAYALGCQLGNKAAIERLHRLRALDKRHNLTLVCRDLSEIAAYAQVSNRAFRFLKAHTPGAYTFILPATKEVPHYFQRKARANIGLRVPDNRIVQELLRHYNQAIASTTLLLAGQEEPLCDPEIMMTQLSRQVDLIIDGGIGSVEVSTIIDLCEDRAVVVRRGRGPLEEGMIIQEEDYSRY